MELFVGTMNKEHIFQKTAILTNTMHDYASRDAPSPTHNRVKSASLARLRKHNGAAFRMRNDANRAQEPLLPMPQIQRISMVPAEFERNPLRCFVQKLRGKRRSLANEPTE